ncbi:aprataxin isoform X2 [Patella vulgata]|nr:aprataxin isoform X2 [Patella vulgata]
MHHKIFFYPLRFNTFRSIHNYSVSLPNLRKMASSNSAKKKGPGHWSTGLLTSMEDPEMKVDEDDKCVTIKDKYPKAQYHFLVLPKDKISNLKNLNGDNVELLKHIHFKGQEIADKADKHLLFRFGYHAVPSMGQLHLHVISQDFNSPCLKTKKHWNSFTTEYFIDSERIIKQLENKGRIEIDTSSSETLLKKDLQ